MANDTSQPTISMMKLRSQPGTILDEVYYKNLSVVIEKSGKPRAALVSIGDFQQMQKSKKEAKERLASFMEKVQKRTAKYNKKEVQKAIDEAVTVTRGV